MIRPTVMTVAILNAMWIWNDYLLPYLVIGSEYKTISVAIQYLRGGYGSIDLGLMMAMLVLAIIPIVIFYMVCQKWIIQGVIAGAVKDKEETSMKKYYTRNYFRKNVYRG